MRVTGCGLPIFTFLVEYNSQISELKMICGLRDLRGKKNQSRKPERTKTRKKN